MKQDLLSEALNIIRNRKEKAEHEAYNQKLKAMQDKSFAQMYKKYVDTLIENARKEAFGEKCDPNEVANLKSQYMQRLKELNIPSIEANYSCKKCRDAGFTDGQYCDCLKKEVSKILLEKSNFGKLEDFKDSDFNIFENQEEMKKIYNLMYQWSNKNDTNKNLVYLLGQTGTGKTHLLRCMANEFIRQNKLVILTTAFNLSQLFIKYHSSKDKEALNDILSCEVLFIDDLGTEPFFNNITREYTYLVINERRMKNLKTVITSNLSPAELRDRYDERIFSRVMDRTSSIVLELKGEDKRFASKK